jgi:hypothetical protein
MFVETACAAFYPNRMKNVDNAGRTSFTPPKYDCGVVLVSTKACSALKRTFATCPVLQTEAHKPHHCTCIVPVTRTTPAFTKSRTSSSVCRRRCGCLCSASNRTKQKPLLPSLLCPSDQQTGCRRVWRFSQR